MADPVEEVAGRLYGLPLEDFTRERDAAARELRKAKDRDAAAVVAKLPKPSQASWAANTLARERRDLVDALLGAGLPIGAYRCDELWFDIGRQEDYERAVDAWSRNGHASGNGA